MNIKFMLTSLISFLLLFGLQSYAQNNSDTSKTSSIIDTTVFIECEIMPYINTKEYKSYEKYLLKNTIYPSDAPTSGSVSVEFIIEIDGTISNIKIIKSLNPICDKEVIRVISRCPKWNPGIQNGKKVRVKKVSKFYFT